VVAAAQEDQKDWRRGKVAFLVTELVLSAVYLTCLVLQTVGAVSFTMWQAVILVLPVLPLGVVLFSGLNVSILVRPFMLFFI
jgi:hypothetical protein